MLFNFIVHKFHYYFKLIIPILQDGHMLKTLDTHKIFYDGEGRPISDIVSISPLASKGPYKERSSKAKDNSSTALALYLYIIFIY